MNGQGGGLRKRREECERGERCCGVITESSYSLVRLAAWSMCMGLCVKLLSLNCAHMSEWVLKFAHSSVHKCIYVCEHECVFLCACLFLDVLMVHPVYALLPA